MTIKRDPCICICAQLHLAYYSSVRAYRERLAEMQKKLFQIKPILRTELRIHRNAQRFRDEKSLTIAIKKI